MRTPIAVFLVVAIAAFALPANRAVMANVIPPIGLAPGSQYQLIFVTADSTTATSTDINYYNAFVTAEAALGSTLPSGVTWHAVVSTPTVNANVNAPSIGLPVYNTLGIAVRSGTTGLYNPAGLDSPIESDQFGTPFTDTSSASLVWTGSGVGGVNIGLPMGTAIITGPVNPQEAEAGVRVFSDFSWIQAGGGNAGFPGAFAAAPIYALSTPITVPTPEPATLTLLGIGLLVIGGMRLLPVTIRARTGEKPGRR